jgi:hypothetical protein
MMLAVLRRHRSSSSSAKMVHDCTLHTMLIKHIPNNKHIASELQRVFCVCEVALLCTGACIAVCKTLHVLRLCVAHRSALYEQLTLLHCYHYYVSHLKVTAGGCSSCELCVTAAHNCKV